MENSRDAFGFQGFKLFGTMISMKATQVKESAKQGDPREKRLEKPLPCPRCRSTETKFCYFNNYNVNQPRHFCRGCQRYWTAGGTLRNIPYGAGRRRNRLPSHNLTRFSNGFMLEPSETSELCLEKVLQQWHVSSSLSSKRPNNSSSGQIC